jgi:hypothetical protein
MSYVTRVTSQVLALGLVAAAAPALAFETVTQQVPPAEACIKTIKTMGGSMGHEAATSQDGRPIYRFILRTAGVDYDAICDAETGVVKDVTRRFTP